MSTPPGGDGRPETCVDDGFRFFRSSQGAWSLFSSGPRQRLTRSPLESDEEDDEQELARIRAAAVEWTVFETTSTLEKRTDASLEEEEEKTEEKKKEVNDAQEGTEKKKKKKKRRKDTQESTEKTTTTTTTTKKKKKKIATIK